MVRQRNGIRASRLTVALVGLVLLVLVGRQLWHRIAKAPIQDARAIRTESNETSETEKRQHPLDPVLALARQALEQHRAKHTCYTATMLKTERIGSKLMPQAKMELKLRYEPPNVGDSLRNVSVYLRFFEPKNQAGREVIYSHGKNDNLLCAHEGGLLGLVSVNLAPTSRIAMTGNRYPITEVGLEKLLVRLIEMGERDKSVGECQVNRKSGQEVAGRTCELIEVVHPEKTTEVEGKKINYEFHIAKIWFDEQILLPIKYASYSWPTEPDGHPQLEEEYQYDDLVLNPGLTDIDFDTENTAYRF